MLGVSPRTVRRYVKSGDLAAYHLPSGHVRIPQVALQGLLERGASLSCKRRGKAAGSLTPGYSTLASLSDVERFVASQSNGVSSRACATGKGRSTLGATAAEPDFFDTSPATLAQLHTAPSLTPAPDYLLTSPRAARAIATPTSLRGACFSQWSRGPQHAGASGSVSGSLNGGHGQSRNGSH